MTIIDYAKATGRSTRTIRRWIRSGLLPAKRVKLGLDWCAFRYDIAEESIGYAQHIHERQMRKLGGMSPGLWRYLLRKLGKTDRTTAMRHGTGFAREPIPVRCPRCGYSLTW